MKLLKKKFFLTFIAKTFSIKIGKNDLKSLNLIKDFGSKRHLLNKRKTTYKMFALRKFKFISKSLKTSNLFNFLNKPLPPKFFLLSFKNQRMSSDNQPKLEAQQEPLIDAEGKALSKNALKKLEQKKQKAEKKAQHQTTSTKPQQQAAEEEDPLKENYGEYELIQSQEITDRKWASLDSISEASIGTIVLIRARVHNIRAKGPVAFIILRDSFHTMQCVAFIGEFVSKKMMKFISSITKESIIDVIGEVTSPEQEILSCTKKQELKVRKVYLVSKSHELLPFQIEDASRKIEKGEEEETEEEEKVEIPHNNGEKDEKKTVKVFMQTRLNNRIIDLRTQSKQAIFILSSGICQLFREFLYSNQFVEIHTPKLIGGASEGGANVFKLKYFGKDACLAQSPQLYKQMCVMSDMKRVFEIGPVFRAENSLTHRHMCEFTGLDLEMTINEHYFELMDFMADLFIFIFEGIEKRYSAEIKTIDNQYPFEPFVCKKPVLKLTFEEACAILKENGIDQSVHEDFSTEIEKKLGVCVKAKHGTDFYMVHRYPISARPFYTMVCKDNDKFTNSYDFFMRGEEITSGSQRIHDPKFLEQRAKECGIEVESIQGYINAFKYGSYPHGGCGIGLERVVMLYCALGNIRNASLFPRDPKRLMP